MVFMEKRMGNDHAASVQAMFARIASRYDFMNRVMTAGQDRRWRRLAIDRARLSPNDRILDLGAGTGDLSAEILRRGIPVRMTAADYTLEMMQLGRTRRELCGLPWVNIDALQTPFAAGTFDVVVSGYLMRNVSDVTRAWEEQYRLLHPGGCVVCLDTTPPPPGWKYAPIHFYLKFILPLLGWLLTGDRAAYTYLPESTAHFLTAEALAESMRRVGFREVGFHRLAFGTMAIHWGYK